MKQRSTSPVAAKPSATIVLVREGPQDPELLMVKRRAGDVFGDSYAFPGGVVDDDESAAHSFSQGKTAEEANAELAVLQGGLNYYVAAIRELFEETGILLVRDNAGRLANTGTAFDLPELRQQVDKGTLPWSKFLREQSLRMACDELHYFAHWETPLSRPKRWSTRFFLATMPFGQDASHDGRELTDSRWLSAADALSLGREGGMKLPFPTLRNLRTLSEFSAVDDMLEWAKKQALQGVQKKRPVEISDNGKTKFVVRGDPGYPEGGDEDGTR